MPTQSTPRVHRRGDLDWSWRDVCPPGTGFSRRACRRRSGSPPPASVYPSVGSRGVTHRPERAEGCSPTPAPRSARPTPSPSATAHIDVLPDPVRHALSSSRRAGRGRVSYGSKRSDVSPPHDASRPCSRHASEESRFLLIFPCTFSIFRSSACCGNERSAASVQCAMTPEGPPGQSPKQGPKPRLPESDPERTSSTPRPGSG